MTSRMESFCWRVEQLAGEGGFAVVTGAPGVGKSVTLRVLAERLAGLRDVQVGVLSRPQAGMADFYREMASSLASSCIRTTATAGPRCCGRAGRGISIARSAGQYSSPMRVRRCSSPS